MNTQQQLERAQTHLRESIEVKQAVIANCMTAILAAAHLLTSKFSAGGKLLLCGNGGSAADCQHMAAEFTSQLTKTFVRPALPAIALTTDTSFLTAFTNDCGYENVFARLVEAYGKPGDVLLGISTSGGSTNVVRAVETAKKLKMSTIALIGNYGQLLDMVDVVIAIPSTSTQYIQESHLAVEHIICDLVEQSLYGNQ